MVIIPDWTKKGAFCLTSAVESTAFKLLRLASLPAWILFALARPDDEGLGYDELLELNSEHLPVPKPSPEARHRQQVKWARRVAHLARLYSLNSMLEVGCGSGSALHYLQRLGFQVSAVDIQDHIGPVARDSPVQFAVGDVCGRLPFPASQFGLVFSMNSFEHFEQVGSAMGEILRVTKSGSSYTSLLHPFGSHQGGSTHLGDWECPILRFSSPRKQSNGSWMKTGRASG